MSRLEIKSLENELKKDSFLRSIVFKNYLLFLSKNTFIFILIFFPCFSHILIQLQQKSIYNNNISAARQKIYRSTTHITIHIILYLYIDIHGCQGSFILIFEKPSQRNSYSLQNTTTLQKIGGQYKISRAVNFSSHVPIKTHTLLPTSKTFSLTIFTE